MTPNFNNQDLVIVTRFMLNLKVNDVVLLLIPKLGIVIKRIYFMDKNSIKVKGDNMDYYSPIYNKTYNKDEIIGKVIYKF